MLYYKGVTASQRGTCLINKKVLEKKIFLKQLYLKKYNCLGRNGKILTHHRELGSKKRFRNIDFYYIKEIPFSIESKEYDPNRSAFINLIYYMNGIYSYVLSTYNTFLGKYYSNNLKSINNLSYGNRYIHMNIPIGYLLHNISTNFFEKSKYARSAGSFGILFKKDNKQAFFRLPSMNRFKRRYGYKNARSIGLRKFLVCSLFGMGTLGKVSNFNHRNIIIGKAGRSRWLGKRPIVRGVAMNPVDHPHGGGEGKKSKNVGPTNKWKSIIKKSRCFKRK